MHYIFLGSRAFSSPMIISVFPNKDIVIVKWEARNVNGIECLELELLSNTIDEIFPICKEFNDAIVRFPLEPGQYTLTLIAYDFCEENYSSLPYYLKIEESELTTQQVSTQSLAPMQSIKITENNKAARSLSSTSVVTPTVCMKKDITGTVIYYTLH